MKESDYLEQFIENIQYVGRMMKRNQRDQALPYGITKTQWFILRNLTKESSTIGELANKLEVRSSSMSQMIDRLELAGLVERHLDSSDARSKKIVLSDAGKKHMEAVSTNRMELLSAPFSQFTEEEQRQIVTLMEKFKVNLSISFEHTRNNGFSL